MYKRRQLGTMFSETALKKGRRVTVKKANDTGGSASADPSTLLAKLAVPTKGLRKVQVTATQRISGAPVVEKTSRGS